jgi:hypothetical protein
MSKHFTKFTRKKDTHTVVCMTTDDFYYLVTNNASEHNILRQSLQRPFAIKKSNGYWYSLTLSAAWSDSSSKQLFQKENNFPFSLFKTLFLLICLPLPPLPPPLPHLPPLKLFSMLRFFEKKSVTVSAIFPLLLLW